jgi:hypothetical protein
MVLFWSMFNPINFAFHLGGFQSYCLSSLRQLKQNSFKRYFTNNRNLLLQLQRLESTRWRCQQVGAGWGPVLHRQCFYDMIHRFVLLSPNLPTTFFLWELIFLGLCSFRKQKIYLNCCSWCHETDFFFSGYRFFKINFELSVFLGL